jgi:bacteriocin biosynthesis cyclodehydratase domain-containing protein
MSGVTQSVTEYMANPSLSIFEVGGGSLIVRHGTRASFSLIIDDPTGNRLLARLLLGSPRIRSLSLLIEQGIVREEERETGISMLSELVEEKVVVPPSHSPWVAYGSLLGDGHWSGHDNAQSTCSVVSDGMFGDELVRLLAVMGITIRDHQKVPGRAGDELVPQCVECLNAADLVIVALDSYRPSVLERLNAAAAECGVKCLIGYVDGARAVIGPLHLPRRSPCWAEAQLQLEAATSRPSDQFLFSEDGEDDRKVRGTSNLLQATLCAAWVVQGLLTALLGSPDASPFIASIHIIDFESSTTDSIPLLRLPRCPACGETSISPHSLD